MKKTILVSAMAMFIVGCGANEAKAKTNVIEANTTEVKGQMEVNSTKDVAVKTPISKKVKVVDEKSYRELTKEELVALKGSSKVFANPQLVFTKGMDLGPVYFIQMSAAGSPKPMEGFLDKVTGSVYIGGGYDADGKKFSFPKNAKVIEDGIAFSYGTGSKELYLVTDPECPYCAKFFEQTKNKLKDYKVNVVLIALGFHKKAPAMNGYILSGKNNDEKYARYVEIMNRSGVNYSDGNKTDLTHAQAYDKKAQSAAAELEARGTPSLYVKEGDKFNSIHWTQLVK